MLKKKYRIRSWGRFFDKSLAADFFFVRSRRNGLLYNRFGFAVSKKVDKRATTRNRLRRVLSSIIEELFDRIKPGYDIGFSIKRGMIGKKRKDVSAQALFMLERENLLK